MTITALLAAGLMQTAPVTADQLSWMSGYWLSCEAGREVSETWTDPRGGLMAGHAVTLESGQATFELSRIAPTSRGAPGVAYFAGVQGAPAVIFPAVEAGGTRVVFEKSDHDFPQRVIYERVGDVLNARIEGHLDGREQAMTWSYRKADLNALPGLTGWRSMTAADLDRVAEIATIGFPDHFEGRPCFANRLDLSPSGCFVLQTPQGLEGYLVAYPWAKDAAPRLNTLIEAIPTDAEVLYLHDLALTPAVRGQGWSKPAVRAVVDLASAGGWATIALVAVNDAVAFWRGHGFEVRQTPELAAKLASYGPDARYMTRPA